MRHFSALVGNSFLGPESSASGYHFAKVNSLLKLRGIGSVLERDLS